MARGKKAAEEPQNEAAESAPAPAQESPFVRMRKGDDTIDVHPLCVADHESIGWSRA